MGSVLKAFGLKCADTRKFNGETYRLHSDHLSLSRADLEAHRLRSRGWKARVVDVLGVYAVYKRRK